ncbi:hypothetical protein RV12_GL002440 [Enterococcus quebecensis]|nr:hypothetical protein RV12_GL002440 [Enterococcus quebecensis]
MIINISTIREIIGIIDFTESTAEALTAKKRSGAMLPLLNLKKLI